MSFCDISFNRTGGSVTDVLNKEGRESALYPQLVSYVQQDPQTVYDSKKEYFDTLVDQGKLVEGKIKKGVDFVFNENPELAKIGNKEQYSQYLDSVFPDSKVKDVVYRGDKSNEINGVIQFLKGERKDLLYLSNNKEVAKNRLYHSDFSEFIYKKDKFGNLTMTTEYEPDESKSLVRGPKNFIAAIVNIQKPLVKNAKNQPYTDYKIDGKNEYETIKDAKEKIRNQENDSLIVENVLEGDVGRLPSTNIGLSKPEQIHILGSKEDIEGFKSFVQQQKSTPIPTDELALGLYSIAYNSGVSEQEFMDRINRDSNLSVFGVGDKQSTKRKKQNAAPDSTEMFLKDIVEKGLSKENQLLAKRLSSIPGFKNVTVEVANIPQYVMYNKAENKIQVSQVAMETVDPIAFEKAILNTVMESIADNMLTMNRNALRSNQKFYGYISDMVKDLERRMPQEMKDMMNQPILEGKVAAFISQYMSNPELREWSNKRIGDKKNFWNQLSNFVATNLFDKKILETSMYEFLSELENIPTVVAPAIINNVLANNTQKVEQLPDYSSLANIYGDLSFFDSAKVRIKEQINMEDLKNKVAAVNRFYGGEVLSLVETKDGTELRFSSSNLNKLIENGKKFMEKKREDKNKMELSKEVKKEARMVDTIPELSFLTEEQKEEAERLLKSNEFNLQCGL